MNLIIILFNCFELTSYPINNYSAYYNPAGLNRLPVYEILIAPNDIGQVNFYSFSARFGATGIAFSGSQPPYVNKNWFTLSRQFKFPLAFGLNVGLEEEDYDNQFFTDLAFFSSPLKGKILFLTDSQLKLGLTGYDLLSSDRRTIRLGTSYNYQFLRLSIEVEDSLSQNKFIPYFVLSGRFVRKDLAAEAGLGFEGNHFCCGLNINLFNFGLGLTYVNNADNTLKFYIALAFKERTIEKVIVKEREVQKIKEVVVEKPIFIDRVVEKPKEKKQYKLTLRQKKFCERHYQLGIKYYTEGNLKQAIAEWEKVYAIAPDYENVEINLINTKEKLRRIEEGNGNQ